MPIADHQPPAVLVPLGSMRGQVGVNLGLQGGGQHPPGALAHELVEIGAQLAMRLGIGDYTQYAAFLPRRRWPAGAPGTCHPGRYAALTSPDLIRLEWIPPGLGQGYPQHRPQTHNRQERTDHGRRDGSRLTHRHGIADPVVVVGSTAVVVGPVVGGSVLVVVTRVVVVGAAVVVGAVVVVGAAVLVGPVTEG
jgi:hypothetical protein